MIPQKDDAENLLVTFCVSATHICLWQHTDGAVNDDRLDRRRAPLQHYASIIICSVQNLPYDLLKISCSKTVKS